MLQAANHRHIWYKMQSVQFVPCFSAPTCHATGKGLVRVWFDLVPYNLL